MRGRYYDIGSVSQALHDILYVQLRRDVSSITHERPNFSIVERRTPLAGSLAKKTNTGKDKSIKDALPELASLRKKSPPLS